MPKPGPTEPSLYRIRLPLLCGRSPTSPRPPRSRPGGGPGDLRVNSPSISRNTTPAPTDQRDGWTGSIRAPSDTVGSARRVGAAVEGVAAASTNAVQNSVHFIGREGKGDVRPVGTVPS